MNPGANHADTNGRLSGPHQASAPSGPIVSIRHLKVAAKILVDFTLAVGALVVAFELRFAGAIPHEYVAMLPFLALGVAGGKTLVNNIIGGHSRIWHYTSAHEAIVLTYGATFSTVVLGVLSVTGTLAVPLSVLAIDGMLFLLSVCAVRMIRRMQVTLVKKRTEGVGGVERVRTLVIGAGDTANSLIGDLHNRNHTDWDVVGLLDDDPNKRGAKMRGIPVLGPTTQMEGIIQRENIRHVVIVMPSAQKAVVRSLISRAQNRGCTVQAIPALEDLLRNGKPAAGTVPVTLADLVEAAEVKKSLLSRVRRQRHRNTILVTGGAGYTGCLLVRKLLDRGHHVRVLDNFTYGSGGLDPLIGHERLEVVEGDISSIRDVVSAVKDVDAVVALAAIVGDPACGLNAEETLNLNYESTKVLVETCNFYGVQRLVFASSCSVYGASHNEILTETSALNPVSLYARTRILSEDVIFERCGDVVPVILRLATVFGLSPRMRFDLVVNTLTARAVVDRRIQIVGGDQWRPFVHCQDAAEAFVLAATASPELVRGEIFNVGNAEMNFTIGQVGDVVADEVGDDVAIELIEVEEDPRNYRVSCEKIEKALGFRPEYDLRAGVREMIVAIEETPRLRNYDHVAYSNLKLLKDRFESAGISPRNEPYISVR